MARSKIYGGGGLTGQFLRDTAFSDEIGPGKYVNRGLQTKSAPPPSEQVTPTLRATLVNDTDAVSHGDLLLPATQARASQATFLQRDQRYIAPINDIRQERLGTDGSNALGSLMELASTNVFLNSASPATQSINLAIGQHTFSVEGSGSLTSANAGGTATGHGAATQGNPVTINVTAAGLFSFTVAGSLAYAQVEAGPVASSFIITQGSAGTRAIDTLTWPITDSKGRNVQNQSEGMCAFIFRPAFSASDLSTGVNLSKTLVDFGAVNQDMGFQKTNTEVNLFRAYTGTAGETSSVQLVSPLTKDQIYVYLLRWNASSNQLQVGYKSSGTTTWATTAPYTSWGTVSTVRLAPAETSGAYDPMYGAHYKSFYLWGEDKGTAWLEALFAGVAN